MTWSNFNFLSGFGKTQIFDMSMSVGILLSFFNENHLNVSKVNLVLKRRYLFCQASKSAFMSDEKAQKIQF